MAHERSFFQVAGARQNHHGEAFARVEETRFDLSRDAFHVQKLCHDRGVVQQVLENPDIGHPAPHNFRFASGRTPTGSDFRAMTI